MEQLGPEHNTRELYDDRDEVDPDFLVDPEFSCSGTDFGGKDPAMTEVDSLWE